MSMSMFGRDKFGQIQQLRAELLCVRKTNLLKDDTIAFLQKEKESLSREIKHYEIICAGVESDVALQHKYEQELKNLRTDIQHWKEVVKRHKHAAKSLTRENTTFDLQHKTLVEEINNNLNTLLSDIPTENSGAIRKQLGEIIDRSEHESSWHLLEVTNKALFEIKTHVNKYKLETIHLLDTKTVVPVSTMDARILDSMNRKPIMKYTHTFGEPIPHSQPSRSAMSRLAKQSISSRRSSIDSNGRTTSATSKPEFRTIPGFLPGLKKRLGE